MKIFVEKMRRKRIKTFEVEQGQAAGDASLYWEQVKVDEGGGDVLSGFSVGQNCSCRIARHIGA